MQALHGTLSVGRLSGVGDAASGGGALAAILRQIGEQRVHDGISGRIDQGAALPAEGHEIGVLELVQVERQRRRRKPEPLADLSRGQPLRAGLHQQPEDIEARLVGERDKGRDSGHLFHSSNILEILIASIPSRRPIPVVPV